MNKLIAMVRKELIDAARDKRSVMAGLYYAIGTPLIMCGMFMVLINQLTSPEDLNITINKAENAPDLVRYLSRKGINQADLAASPDADVKAITLTITEDYAANMAKAKSAEVIILADNSDEKLQKSIRRSTL